MPIITANGRRSYDPRRPQQIDFTYQPGALPDRRSRSWDTIEYTIATDARDPKCVTGTALFDIHCGEKYARYSEQDDEFKPEWPLAALRRLLLTGPQIPGLRTITREVPDDVRFDRGFEMNGVHAHPGYELKTIDHEYVAFARDVSYGSAYLVDFHATRGAGDPDVPFVGPNGFHNAVSYGLACELGFDKVLVHSNRHLAAHLWRHNYLGADLGPESDLPYRLPAVLAEIAQGRWEPPTQLLTPYFCVGDIGCKEAEQAGLLPEYPAFHELPFDKLRNLPRFEQRFGGMRLHALTWSSGLYPSGMHEVVSSVLPPWLAKADDWRGRITRGFVEPAAKRRMRPVRGILVPRLRP